MTPDRPFAPPLPRNPARALPWFSVIAGSLLTAVPLVAHVPLLPPFGLLMLLGWRLLARYAMRRWAAAPLGFVDDLLSGQPLGSAVLLWSLCFLMIDLIEQRLAFRDFWQDWLIAAGLLALALWGGRLIAVPLAAHLDAAVVAQWGMAVLLFPLATRVAAWIDAKRAYP
ncbi:rod shape-determining protein MreD [Sphingomonas sp.]|uniref:rod shape-determining protein MreD n=1 Tax=Sphingomonas sp. TaxID=28214 RepID=UPI003CC6AB8D